MNSILWDTVNPDEFILYLMRVRMRMSFIGQVCLHMRNLLKWQKSLWTGMLTIKYKIKKLAKCRITYQINTLNKILKVQINAKDQLENNLVLLVRNKPYMAEGSRLYELSNIVIESGQCTCMTNSLCLKALVLDFNESFIVFCQTVILSEYPKCVCLLSAST